MIATGKKRIVDFLVGDIKRVKAGLGAHEAAAFESHLEALDAINIELDKAMATGGNAPPTSAAAICSYKSIEGLFPANLGNTGNRAWYYQGANAPAIYRIQRAIMVQAMACGITRVGVWGMGCSHQESHIPAEGVIDDPNQVHHLQAHSDSESFASNQQGQMREIARMVSDMKAIDVGGKTLFDDTLVYAATDIGDNAAAHGGNNIGAFILGNLGGKLKGGRIVDGKGAPYNHLLVTMGQLMGLKDETIGNTAAKGPVSGIIS
ncbi:DUF1552 domain-containing protein [bacterium]|nr:MAG: DUF1552 domain-containing protein [bacterium]